MTEKPKHGGKRKGAGRPVEEIKRVMIAVRLPPDLVEKLRKVEDQTALIESLLRDYFEGPA